MEEGSRGARVKTTRGDGPRVPLRSEVWSGTPRGTWESGRRTDGSGRHHHRDPGRRGSQTVLPLLLNDQVGDGEYGSSGVLCVSLLPLPPNKGGTHTRRNVEERTSHPLPCHDYQCPGDGARYPKRVSYRLGVTSTVVTNKGKISSPLTPSLPVSSNESRRVTTYRSSLNFGTDMLMSKTREGWHGTHRQRRVFREGTRMTKRIGERLTGLSPSNYGELLPLLTRLLPS